MKVRFEETRTKLQELVTLARKVTICLDAWTKKGLSGVPSAACLLDPSVAAILLTPEVPICYI